MVPPGLLAGHEDSIATEIYLRDAKFRTLAAEAIAGKLAAV